MEAESIEPVVLMPSKLSTKWGKGELPSPCCRRAVVVDHVFCVPSLLQQQYMLFTLQTVTACARKISFAQYTGCPHDKSLCHRAACA